MLLFLFGERVHSASLDAGEHVCPVCARRTRFTRVVETNYFCVFGLRLVPIDKVANYYQCGQCGNPFDADFDLPAQVPLIKSVLAYVLVGYGMTDHREVAQEICRKISGFDLTDEELTDAIRVIASGKSDIDVLLKRDAMTINTLGALQVVQAAFLMTYVSCEIQYEDRLRVNRIGTALGISLELVQRAIESVRDQKYFGVHRLLPTRLT